MSEEWTDWIEHHLNGVPLPNGTFVHCVYEDGFELKAHVTANGRDREFNPWFYNSDGSYIVRYRVRKPRALQQFRDLIADVPAPAKEDA